jgi:hypothetical protein
MNVPRPAGAQGFFHFTTQCGPGHQLGESVCRAHEFQNLRAVMVRTLKARALIRLVLQAATAGGYQEILCLIAAGYADPQIAFQAQHHPADILFMFARDVRLFSIYEVPKSNMELLENPA